MVDKIRSYEVMEEFNIVNIISVGVVAFVGWLIRERFIALDKLETRVTTLETKLDVMGDINSTLHELKTDVAVIKQRLEPK